MTDHPSTFKGGSNRSGETAWNDRAAIHAAADDASLFGGSAAVRSGTFAEMIHHLASLPADTRQRYAIEKAGDRRYSADEAMALASHPDFPAKEGE